MTAKRRLILAGMAAGLLWALALVGGIQAANPAFVPLPIAMPLAMLPPGLVMAAVIARLAQRRFFDDAIIDGATFAPGSGAEIDQRVLTNTTEQVVLALVLWPFVAVTLGGAVVIAMGIGFAIARLAFWIGYHASPPLRGFGFAGTFYPTLVATFWALLAWMS